MNTIALFTFWLLEWCVTILILVGIQVCCVFCSLTRDENSLIESGEDEQWQKVVECRVALVYRWWILVPLALATSEVVSLAFHTFFPFLP